MKALTFWPVWAWLVVHGDKDVENRTWLNSVVRQLIENEEPFAIHAAARETQAEHDWAVEVAARVSPWLRLPVRSELVCGAVVGTAKIWSWVPPTEQPTVENKWHLPSTETKKYYGWCLHERQAFQQPILAKGGQGFWTWKR